MYPAVSFSSRRRPLFPPLPEDPVADSPLRESDIISRDSSSSDDDNEKTAKRRRMLKHAESYLRGEPLYLHSARLRGPVVKNPWGKSGRQVKRKDGDEEDFEGGIRKKLKRCNIGEEAENGREILPTPTHSNKGKGILTSRGTNTIDDVIPEPSTPTPLRTRSPAAANATDRHRSRSPVLRVKRGTDYPSQQDRHHSPFDISKQTDEDAFIATVFKTPVKKKRSPIEVPPVCSPSTFYSRPKPLENLPPVPHQRRSTSYSSPQETQKLSSKPKRSSSTKNKTPKPQEVSDTIVVAKSILDVDLKKKRPKIDFTAKSPYLKSAPEQTKPSRGRKKKMCVGKDKETKAQPEPGLEVDGIGPAPSKYHTERLEDTKEGPAEEEVLNDWLNRHVAASQSFQIQDNDAFGNSSNTNPDSKELYPVTSEIPAEAIHESIFVSASLPVATELNTTRVVALPSEEAASRPMDIHNPQDMLQTPILEAATVQLAQTAPEKTPSPPPAGPNPTVVQSPTPKSQPTEAPEQAQIEQAEVEQPAHEADEQLQSQTASWQNTQYQLHAAQKSFFDALQDSPVVYGPYISTETPGRDLLRPIGFFDNEIVVKETPWPGNNIMTDNDSASSPFQTPGFTGRSVEWGVEDDRNPLITPFKSTFGEGGESPPGTTFTPFRAFATPESSPKPATESAFSPITFSPMKEPTQQLDGSASTTQKSVKFGGFGLLDDDDDDDDDEGEPTNGNSGSGFSPVNYRERGQQADTGAGLVEDVMEFMGGGVWDIDEELRKMAQSSAGTPGTPGGTISTPGTGKKGKGRDNSVRKRRLHGRRT